MYLWLPVVVGLQRFILNEKDEKNTIIFCDYNKIVYLVKRIIYLYGLIYLFTLHLHSEMLTDNTNINYMQFV